MWFDINHLIGSHGWQAAKSGSKSRSVGTGHSAWTQSLASGINDLGQCHWNKGYWPPSLCRPILSCSPNESLIPSVDNSDSPAHCCLPLCSSPQIRLRSGQERLPEETQLHSLIEGRKPGRDVRREVPHQELHGLCTLRDQCQVIVKVFRARQSRICPKNSERQEQCGLFL